MQDPAPTVGPRVAVLPLTEPRTAIGRRWIDTPLRRKLLTVIALLTLVWVPPIAIGAVVDHQLGAARADVASTAASRARLDDVQDSLRRAASAIESYLIEGLVDAGAADRTRAEAAQVERQLATLGEGIAPELERPTRALDAAVTEQLAEYERVLEFGVAGTEPADVSDDPRFYEFNPALADAMVESLAAGSAVNDGFEELELGLDELLQAQRRDVDRRQGLLLWAPLVAMVAAVVVAAGSSYAVTNGVVRRVEILSENADRFIRDDPLLPAEASSDEIGQVTDRMLFAGDLLNRRRAEAVTATRAKDEFLSRVSHELKTPLTAMIGFAQLLEEDPDLPASRRNDAVRIVTAGHQLHELIEELLDIRAIETGKFAVAIEPVTVHEALTDAAALTTTTLAGHSADVAVECPPGLVVAADRRRLREVLLNLLSNAVKYSYEGDPVTLAAVAAGDRVRIRVTDSGPGITADDQVVLFRPFGRLGAGGEEPEGTRIGLSLAKHVVQAMGGTIGVESSPGHGTTIWFDLPTSSARPDALPAAVSPAPAVPAEAPPADPGVPDAGVPDAGVLVEPGGRDTPGRSSRNPLVPRGLRARTRLGQRWLDTSLRRKLLVVVVLVAVVWLPPIAIAAVINERIADARQEAEETGDRADALDRLQESLQLSVSAMQNFAVLGLTNDELIEAYRAASAPLPEDLAALRDGLPPDLARPAEELEREVTALTLALDELAALGPQVSAGSEDAATVRYELGTPQAEAALRSLGDILDRSGEAFERVAQIERLTAETLAENFRQVDRLQQLLVWATLASMLAALVVAAGGSYIVINGVVTRISVLSENADRFTRGDPLAPARASSDEIGRLTDQMLVAGELLEFRRQHAVAATRAKDEFLSRISYELTTPLATMIDAAEELAIDPVLSAQSREDAARIAAAGRQLRELIDELLDIKAIEAGRIAIALEPVAVGETAEDAASLVRSMPASRTITIACDCPPEVVVAADRRRLREVLLNLLSNAVKYNRQGGRVDVTASLPGEGTARISVTDTGPGISPEDQARLFQPFERLQAALTDVEGSGVGLALTRHVVHAMGGTIGVDSVAGQGSTFWFELPVADTTCATTGSVEASHG